MSNKKKVIYASVSLTQEDITKAMQYEEVHKNCSNKILDFAKQLREKWSKVGINHLTNGVSIATARKLIS